MQPSFNNPPHIRINDSNSSMMLDTIIALLPLYCLSYYFYGARTVVMALISIVTCIICDTSGVLLSRNKLSIRDYSPIITGMIIPLLLPASVNYNIIIIASIFAIIVAKQPFGGVGENIFNPAAAGIAFAIICWPKEIFAYPTPLIRLPLSSVVEPKLLVSPTFTMQLGGTPNIDYMDMLLGNFAGPMGATSILVLLSCFIYLIVRKTASAKISGAYFAVTAIVAFVFPRAQMQPIESVFYEMMSGALIFGGIFLLNDPVTSPQRDLSRIIYGAFTGLIVMLFRRFGKFEDGVVFAILIANSFVWLVDMFCEEIQRKLRLSSNESR
ncbi:MAG: RnfABCDGE type electron transport complex subunit D [Oscillospiraceae bacterium]